jgi:hypothetical protein
MKSNLVQTKFADVKTSGGGNFPGDRKAKKEINTDGQDRQDRQDEEQKTSEI